MLERHLAKLILKYLGNDFYAKVSTKDPIVWILLKMRINESKGFNHEMLRGNCMIDSFSFGKFPMVYLRIGKMY